MLWHSLQFSKLPCHEMRYIVKKAQAHLGRISQQIIRITYFAFIVFFLNAKYREQSAKLVYFLFFGNIRLFFSISDYCQKTFMLSPWS
ncbi:hypothetical protein [Candidatus Arsenophonus triatominarum]|uniref:hypothetical protein n=1 Tax=Candidatus Arsenophonus triatominarum TaxID=57911 RepID=UPI001650200A|nr:hypothetical protein [Candidatus Arsenophonus triatominarum]